jgi:FAD:protein FMN transferase
MTENYKNKESKPDENQNVPVLSRQHTVTCLTIVAIIGILWMILFPRQVAEKKSSNSMVTIERMFPVMGTIAQYKLHGDKQLVEQAADKVRDSFLEVEKTCNLFNTESELSRLNLTAAAEPFKCSPLLWDVLMESRRAYEISDGAFDITARPLMMLWGFYHKRGDRLPTTAELTEALKNIGMDKVIFDESNRTVKFTQSGVSLDLGGVAKGFAVDRAVAAVKKLGIQSGIINLAGNMYCFPMPFPERKTYRIGVKNPKQKEKLCGFVDLLDSSLSTSGDYERYVTINGKRYAHIMDVRTGKPVTQMRSVTVITASACAADYLSTSIFINGREFAEKICKDMPGTQVLIIREMSDGSSELIKFGDSWQLRDNLTIE